MDKLGLSPQSFEMAGIVSQLLLDTASAQDTVAAMEFLCQKQAQAYR